MNSSTVGLDWSGKEISSVESFDIFRQESMGKSALNLSQCRIAMGFCGALGELLATLPMRALILRDISLRGANEEEEAACHATLLSHVCRLLALEYLDITNTKAPDGAIRALVATLGVRPNMQKVVMAASAADVNVLLRYLPSRVELGVRTTGSRDDVVTWSKGTKGAFADVVALVKEGGKPADVRDDIDDSTDKSAQRSVAIKPRPPKPWERNK